ncbi:unnamed protein product [Closterium sp. NIES-53]
MSQEISSLLLQRFPHSPLTSASIQSSLGPAAFGPTVSSSPEGGMLRGEVRGAAEGGGGFSGRLAASGVTSTSAGGESNSIGSSSSSSSSSSSGGSGSNSSSGDESASKGVSEGVRLERRSIGSEKGGLVKGNGNGESGDTGSGMNGIGVGENGMEGVGSAAEGAGESEGERIVEQVEKETGVGFWGDDGVDSSDGGDSSDGAGDGAGDGDGADGDDGGADGGGGADGDGNNKHEQRKAGGQAEGQAQGGSSEQQIAGSKGNRRNRGRGKGRGGDDKSPPLADTTEKLHRWMDKWRKTTLSLLPSSFQDASLLPILELESPPPVPLPLPNVGPDVPVDPARDPNLWQPFHVKGTPRLVTLFSGECTAYFDWQTLGLMYSFRRSGQPGKLVRLLACNEDMLKEYKGLDLAPTMVVPNWDHDPHNGDW